MDNQQYPISFEISLDKDISDEALERLTNRLFEDLKEIDGTVVEFAKEPLPEGAVSRSGELFAKKLGELVITGFPTVAVDLIRFLNSWIGRRGSGRVKVKIQTGKRVIEIDFSPEERMSPNEMKSLIKTILQELE